MSIYISQKLNHKKVNSILLNQFLIFFKYNFINKNLLFKSFNFLKLTNNKLLKFIILSFEVCSKYISQIVFFIFKILIIFSLKIIFHLLSFIFYSIFKFGYLKVRIDRFLNKIFYLKLFVIFSKLLNRRKKIINPRLREIKLKFIRKSNFKKKLFKHIEKTKKIKLKKIQKYMLTKKLKKRKENNKNFMLNRYAISKHIYKFLELEKDIFNLADILNDKLISIMYKINSISYNLIRILRVFEKNKKVKYLRRFIEFISNKLDLFGNFFNGISDRLNIINNLDQLFKFLFFKKFTNSTRRKKIKRKYFKTFYKYYFFNFILLLFSSLKITLLFNLINNNSKIKILVDKINVFFNLEDYLKQYITNIRFI